MAEEELSDEEIDALLDEAIAEDRAARAAREEPEEVVRPVFQVDRPRASRGFYGSLIILSSLFPLIGFGTFAAIAAFGPELVPEIEGGELDVHIAPFCRQGTTDAGACFERANVTYRYASGATTSYAYGSTGSRDDVPMSFVDGPPEARVTVRVETDRGVWTREYWIPAGTSRTLRIDPDTPQHIDGVIGRQLGAAVQPAAGSAFALLHVVAAAAWLKGGRSGAANALLSLIGVGIVLQSAAVLVPVFTTGSIPFVPLLVLAWTAFLARGVYLWIEANRRVGPDAHEEGPGLAAAAQGPTD